MTPLSQKLIDRAELLSRYHPDRDVASILGLWPSQVSKMRKNGWRETRRYYTRPVPDDFAVMNHRMSNQELTKHYRCSYQTLQRWFRETKNSRSSRRGSALRIDPKTGKRNYELARKGD